MRVCVPLLGLFSESTFFCTLASPVDSVRRFGTSTGFRWLTFQGPRDKTRQKPADSEMDSAQVWPWSGPGLALVWHRSGISWPYLGHIWATPGPCLHRVSSVSLGCYSAADKTPVSVKTGYVPGLSSYPCSALEMCQSVFTVCVCVCVCMGI